MFHSFETHAGALLRMDFLFLGFKHCNHHSDDNIPTQPNGVHIIIQIPQLSNLALNLKKGHKFLLGNEALRGKIKNAKCCNNGTTSVI